MIPDLIARGREPLVGITVSDATITLRIAASGPDVAACEAAMAPTLQLIRAQLGDLVFGEEDDELHDAVLRLLAARGATLATAEWGTAGVLAQWLATAEGAGREAFVGGNVVAALGRSGAVAARSPESSDLAADLARSVQRQYGADYGLGVAAYPSAVDAPEARVGVAIASAERVWPFALPCATHPAIRRQRTAKQALNALRKLLLQDRPAARLA
jgi:nicotinamide-nucleotide amidase